MQCFPSEWVSPLVFQPPWAPSSQYNWYSNAPNSNYPRSGASAFGACGMQTYGVERKPNSNMMAIGRIPMRDIPPTTCTSGPRVGYNIQFQNQNLKNCSDGSCKEFFICDETTGKCAKPNYSGQAT